MKSEQSRNTGLLSNSIWLSFSAIASKGMMFIMVPFFSRWLSTEEFGAFDLICTYVTLMIPLLTLACAEGIFRLAADHEASIEDKQRIFSSGLCIYIANLLLGTVLIVLISRFFDINHVSAFILLLLAESIDNYVQGYTRGIGRLRLYSISRVILTVATVVVTVILVYYMNYGLEGIVLGYVTGYCLSDLFVLICTNYWSYFRFSKIRFSVVKDIIKYSYVLIPNNISWWVMNASDRTIINTFFGTTANGIYAIAHKVPSLCSSVFGMFNVSWQQSVVQELNSAQRDEYFSRIYRNVFRIIVTLCCGVLSVNFVLFDYIFDHKYSEAALYSPILIIAVIPYILSIFYGGIQIGLKNTKANSLSTIIGAAVNIVVHLLLVGFIGMYAASISTLVAYATVLVARSVQISKTCKIKMKTQDYCLLIILAYFTTMAYVSHNLALNIINVVLACVAFLVVNLKEIKPIAKRMMKKLKHSNA